MSTRMMQAFRRRLLGLVAERFEGHYTILARRAGIPVSSLQHVVHHAKHLPGGELLGLLAVELGVSVHFLVTGEETERPAGRLAPPTPVILGRGPVPSAGNVVQVTVPVFRCACPAACPLAENVPSVAAAASRVIFPADLLARRGYHRLLAIEVGPGLGAHHWPRGSRLVVDWDARVPRWEGVTLFRADGRCHVGHIGHVGDRLVVAIRPDGAPQLLTPDAVILGTIVAAMTACRRPAQRRGRRIGEGPAAASPEEGMWQAG